MRHIVSEEEKQQMRELKQSGMSCRQVASLLGISKSTVSAYTGDVAGNRIKREHLQQMFAIKPSTPKTDALYNVKIYFVRKHPDLVICRQLDHRPTYRDMMELCLTHNIPAVDFEDDRGTKIDDRIYHGTVYGHRSRAYILARFTICRLKGKVYLEDFFK